MSLLKIAASSWSTKAIQRITVNKKILSLIPEKAKPSIVTTNNESSTSSMISYSFSSFSAFARSLPLKDMITVQVPTMGDSITEGTIVEWSVPVGGAVSEGDVIALVETDKVTVDIKADVGGVITRRYGELDDTIEVGANLYEIDTEAVATVNIGSNEENPDDTTIDSPGTLSIPPVNDDITNQSSADLSSSTRSRVPSIRFLGKAGWEMRRKSTTFVDNKAVQIEPVSVMDTHNTDVSYSSSFDAWNPMKGRPPLSEDEIEALALGGASVAPTMERASVKAVFRQ